MSDSKGTLTLDNGAPVADNQNSLTAGPNGPVLVDPVLFEKSAGFNRERIPERVVHAKGSGAYGTFTVTKDITKYTRAKIFSEVGKKTPMLARFSTVGGEKGSADTARDPRGFALKFYTEEGNWDLVGNNTPVFFVRDPLKFSDFIHTQKKDPRTNFGNNTPQWDFWSLCPESLHQVLILFSDRGTPVGYRHMNGYGSHTFSLINAKNERVYVKFHFKTEQGIKNFTPAEATRMAGVDADFATRDLYESIEKKQFPRWKLYIQVMTEAEAEKRIEAFDLTKVWPHKEFPLIEVGVMELNQNPTNYFQEIEQSAFSPAHVVPGIGFSPDKMLQGRMVSYADAHRYRVGSNYQLLPVNAPRCPMNNYNQDGLMQYQIRSGFPNYQPNSLGGPADVPSLVEPPLKITGAAARYDPKQGRDPKADLYQQPGNLFRLFKADEQVRLAENLAASFAGVPERIFRKNLEHFRQIDPKLAELVEQRVPKLAKL